MTRGIMLAARFQPLVPAQEAVLAQALALAPRVVVGLLGAHEARSARYPFTAGERIEMISRTFPPSEAARLAFVPLRAYDGEPEQREILAQAFGPGADPTAMELPRGGDAELWDAFYGERPALHGLLSLEVFRFMEDWRRTPYFAALQEEHRVVQEERRRWGTGPFVTLDALVVSQGHVLLVRRGRCPGKGLLALPGGFLEPGEFLLDGALRELQEETGLDLGGLDSELKGVKVFDHPERSQRGRTITHVHHFELRSTALPEVKGADDAAEARWLPLPLIPETEGEFFEDHYHILTSLLPSLREGRP